MSTDDLHDVEQAYLYAYPLVLMDTIRALVTNTETPTETRAPLGQLFHARSMADSSTRSLTRPNVDTLYSQAYLDLGSEPMLLYKPATDRYCSVQLYDGYSNNPAVLGTGGIGGNEETVYALTGPRFTGALPEGVTEVPISTDFVWLLLRFRCTPVPAEVAQAHRIQDQIDLYPLSQHGGEHRYPRGSYDPSVDYRPVDHVGAMDIEDYFNRFNTLAVTNPGTEEDRPALERFARLGIGPGLTFSLASLPEETRARAESLSGFMDGPRVYDVSRITDVGGWMYLDDSIGRFGTDYLYRARIAHRGFANPVDITAYPSTQYDSDRVQLTGTRTYRLHFPAGTLPPHREWGWWSLTAYSLDGRLFTNDLGRYVIDDATDLRFDDDGSLDLWISATDPGPEHRANWLPVESADFLLTMRIYFPTAAVGDHTWQPPAVTPVDGRR